VFNKERELLEELFDVVFYLLEFYVMEEIRDDPKFDKFICY